ncbi:MULTISPECIES: extracellular solute-binding protein [Paenibacillus]|uniref:extracellular solute-binding protein n=1 Tax=Paenibacillus TaxID=44249 RepID=UPI0022B9224A|nr:extracellular solute-binding protein [Paenibacillus caseinilyticus]MCZ8519832.1 extracellular solute-binding protein [Paenibacillus caseinilyticus]
MNHVDAAGMCRIAAVLLLSVLSVSCSERGAWQGAMRSAGPDPVSIVVNSQGMRFPEGLDENRNPYLHYIEEHTGLDVQVDLPPQERYHQSAEALLASGQPPDLISVYSQVWVARQARRGAILPLDEWLQKYGADLRRSVPEAAWAQARYDGKIYAIPSLNPNEGMELMYARKDWLDRLGLQPPRTLEEYKRVIRAFALEDPDGNGRQDTYGLGLMNHLFRSAPFFGAYGVQLNQWVEREGKLVYSNTLPETKKALLFLADLYREGAIDPEFPLANQAKLSQMVERGQVGLFSATWYDTRGMIALNRKRDPQAEWIPLDYPVGPQGHRGVYAIPAVRSYQVVPSGSRHPDRAVRLLNFIGGEGQETLALGFENEVWTRKNGRIVSNFAEHDKHAYRGLYGSLADLAQTELLRTRLDSYGEELRLYDNLERIRGSLIHDAYTGMPTPAMEAYADELNKLQIVFLEIVLGTAPPEAFDRYVEEWTAQGGAAITDEVNAWYRASRRWE